MNDINIIGERIKSRRNSLSLTQTDIHRQCGISSGALSKIENGSSIPSIMIFHKLSQVLECSMDWLMTGLSSNEQISLSLSETSLLNYFRQLNETNQNEILFLSQYKFQQEQTHTTKKSSPLPTTENDIMVG